VTIYQKPFSPFPTEAEQFIDRPIGRALPDKPSTGEQQELRVADIVTAKRVTACGQYGRVPKAGD
jgi:hypothetical protein